MNKTNLTDDEFKLLSDVEERRRSVGDGVLHIRERQIGGGGDTHRLDDLTLENVEFVDCMFLGHMMFDVNMKNVRFTRCGFSGVRWEGGRWTSLTFRDCGFIGRGVSMLPGGGEGASLLERCYFKGTEPRTRSETDYVDLYGSLGVGGKARYVDCEINRFFLYMAADVEVTNCKMDRVSFRHRFEHGAVSLLIDNCTTENDMDMAHAIVPSLTLRNSSFHRVDASRLKSKQVVLEHVSGSFDFMRAEIGQLRATNCVFKHPTGVEDRKNAWGLSVSWVEMDSLLLDQCSFQGTHARLFAPGDPPKRDAEGKIVPYISKKTGKVISYFTEIGSVTLRKTPVARGDFTYSHIQQFTVENAALTDTQLPHSEIGTLILKNVTLSGTLDFSNTQVREVVAENVTKEKLKLVTDKNSKVAL